MKISRDGRPLSVVSDSRLLLGVLLVCAALAGGIALARASGMSQTFLVASRDMPASAPLSFDDVDVAEVRLPPPQAAGLVTPSERESVSGLYTLRPLRAGELLVRSSLGEKQRPAREVSFAVPADASLEGRLRAGDRVDVIATLSKGTPESRTIVLARGAEVISPPGAAEDTASGLSSGAAIATTLAVEGREAMAIAFAASNGDIALIRSNGPEYPLPGEVDSETVASVR